MKFKRGNLIVCVNSKGFGDRLTEGRIYKIKMTHYNGFYILDNRGILNEISDLCENRFELIDEPEESNMEDWYEE